VYVRALLVVGLARDVFTNPFNGSVQIVPGAADVQLVDSGSDVTFKGDVFVRNAPTGHGLDVSPGRTA
jgi:hypothetical protein